MNALPAKNAILLAGGWDGHAPLENARLFADALRGKGFACEIHEDLALLDDPETLRACDLIVPVWTMGELSAERTYNLADAVRAGTGLAGTHGGMGDAFRGNLDYEWMVGGHFVGHPHVGIYPVRVTRPDHPLMAGVPERFEYDSEQYYMLVDPGVEVLAVTDYEFDGATTEVPVFWTKRWGAGRVFYSALGHDMKEFEKWPFVFEATLRGLLWAARDSASTPDSDEA